MTIKICKTGLIIYLFAVHLKTRSSAVAKRPRDASCLYRFYTLEWCGYSSVCLFVLTWSTNVKKSPFSRPAAHIFVSPGDAPGAITLNVVWVEREFDAYKLSRCMCPSNYNRFWDRARYLWKNRHFIIPLAFDAPVRGVPVGISASPLVWKN